MTHPAEDAGHDAGYDVVVVGHGPGGVVAAALLGQAGARVLVVGRGDGPVPHPGAVAAPQVRMAPGWRFAAIEQGSAAATVRLHDASGRQWRVRARYVIGCDGAAASVGELAGLARKLCALLADEAAHAATHHLSNT